MATGYMQWDVPAMVLPDGSSGNAAPAIAREKGSDSNPAKHFLSAAFDASTDEIVHLVGMIPGDYASGGSLKLEGMINSTSAANVIMAAQVACITPGDTDTPLEHAKSTAATVTIAVNTTEANRLLTGTITLNMDSAAAGDFFVITLFRDADNASDTCAVDFRLVAAEFSYTTA